MLSLSIRFSIRKFVYNFLFPSGCNMPCRPHPPWFDHRNKIWWTIQISGALHNAVFSSHLLLPVSSFPNTFLNILFCSSFNLCSFTSMKDHVFEFLLWEVKHFVDRRMNDMHIAALTVRNVLWAYSKKRQPLYPVATAVPCVQLHNVLLSGNLPNFLFLGYLTADSLKNFP
jgi:hypothetical protein